MIKQDFNKYTAKFVNGSDISKFNKQSKKILNTFTNGELSYWNDINSYVNRDELNSILNTANYIRENCDVFVVIGIGGSYMGSKALIEALLPIALSAY